MEAADCTSGSADAANAAPEAADARARLRWHAEHPLAAALRARQSGTPVVGMTSDTVPWELVEAAGCFPLVLRRPRRPTPNADQLLEPDVFSARIRGLFEGIVSGEWSFLRAVVVPRTSEQDYKLFLYLREIMRETSGSGMPPVYLYDLLHTRSPRGVRIRARQNGTSRANTGADREPPHRHGGARARDCAVQCRTSRETPAAGVAGGPAQAGRNRSRRPAGRRRYSRSWRVRRAGLGGRDRHRAGGTAKRTPRHARWPTG